MLNSNDEIIFNDNIYKILNSHYKSEQIISDTLCFCNIDDKELSDEYFIIYNTLQIISSDLVKIIYEYSRSIIVNYVLFCDDNLLYVNLVSKDLLNMNYIIICNIKRQSYGYIVSHINYIYTHYDSNNNLALDEKYMIDNKLVKIEDVTCLDNYISFFNYCMELNDDTLYNDDSSVLYSKNEFDNIISNTFPIHHVKILNDKVLLLTCHVLKKIINILI